MTGAKMSNIDLELREALVGACRGLTRRGLTYGTSGNISVRRDADSFFISPTGSAYEDLEEVDVPLLRFDGRWFGRRRPSSEWRFHRDLLRARADVGAVVHTHSRYATALACTGRGIPAFHYMVAVTGDIEIRCAPYHTFGSQELSDAVLATIRGGKACLLGNHGVIAMGATVAAALDLAGEVENLAAQYIAALTVGDVRLLEAAEMWKVVEKFGTYGKPEAVDVDLTCGGDLSAQG
ncbi:MAG TPA: class II aldolase/adducin family protein [Steroidobacteraceae bacterium]